MSDQFIFVLAVLGSVGGFTVILAWVIWLGPETPKGDNDE